MTKQPRLLIIGLVTVAVTGLATWLTWGGGRVFRQTVVPPERVQYDGLAAVLSDGRVAVCSQPGVLQLNDADGTLLWRRHLPGSDKWITGVDTTSDGGIYAFDWDGVLYALGPDGEPRWRKVIRPPYYEDGPGDPSCTDCIHGGEPVVLSDDRIMVVIRGEG